MNTFPDKEEDIFKFFLPYRYPFGILGNGKEGGLSYSSNSLLEHHSDKKALTVGNTPVLGGR